MRPPFVHRRRILFGDCDPGGIIYTPRVTHFVIEASLEFLTDRLGGPAERRMFEMGIAPPARALSMQYLKRMTWDDELEVHVDAKSIGRTSIVLSFDGRVADETAFTAELTMVCISKESGEPVEVPRAFREALLGGRG